MRRSAVIAVAASDQDTLVACLDRELSVVAPLTEGNPAQGIPAAMALMDETLRRAVRDGVDIHSVVVACSDDAASREICRQAAARVSRPVLAVAFAQAAVEGERLQGVAVGRTSALLLDTDALEIGLLLNGALYRGGSGQAGSVAHLGLDRTGFLRCECGRMGCLSALMAAGDHAPVPPLPADSRPLPSRRLGWLAVALVTLLNTVNPKVLILAGSRVAEPDDFAWLGDTARLGCLAPTRAGLAEVTRACRNRVLVGAASLAFHGHPSAFLEQG